ncbi:MAG: SAM-dependent methyltransferase [Lautropia sp.]
MPGCLLLVPTPLAQPDEASQWLSEPDRRRVAALTRFYVETPKTARAWLQRVPLATPLAAVELRALPRDAEQPRNAGDGAGAGGTGSAGWDDWLAPLRRGEDVGLLSDAGCPGIADPGAALVAAAHAAGIGVVPLVGPSSIVLGLMASGLEGQRFAFHGYLPVEAAARTQAIRLLAARSAERRETQIAIETPYRNGAFAAALLANLPPSARLCVASDLGGAAQSIRTRSVADWRRTPPELDPKRPAIFLFQAEPAPNPRRRDAGGRGADAAAGRQRSRDRAPAKPRSER